MTAKRFQSKVDRWLAAVLIICLVMMLASLIAMSLEVAREPMLVAAIVAIILGIALIAWIGLATYYEIDRTTLTVVSGPMRWHIPLQEISAVEATRSPLSAPALSLDRLRIRYGDNRSIVVSPRDKAKFIKKLGLDRGSQRQ